MSWRRWPEIETAYAELKSTILGGRVLRARTKERIVKRAISPYNARRPAIDRTTYKATITINMLMTGS